MKCHSCSGTGKWIAHWELPGRDPFSTTMDCDDCRGTGRVSWWRVVALPWLRSVLGMGGKP